MTRVSAIRDDRVLAHTVAIEGGDLGQLLVENVTTSVMVGRYLGHQWGGTYDRDVTIGYLRKMSTSQLLSRNDGAGSATAAAYFGTREFARQNPGRPWTVTWTHHGGGNSRPEHVAADGTTVRVGEDFGINPGMGSPGCLCTAELST